MRWCCIVVVLWMIGVQCGAGGVVSAADTQPPDQETSATIILKGPPEPQPFAPLFVWEVEDELALWSRDLSALDALLDEFMRSYQAVIQVIEHAGKRGGGREEALTCSNETFLVSYREAKSAFERYRVVARRARDHQRRIGAFERAGYGDALTPDLRERARRLLTDYERARKEHTRIRAVFREQIEKEWVRLGCDPRLLAMGGEDGGEEGASVSGSSSPPLAPSGDAPGGGEFQSSSPGVRDGSFEAVRAGAGGGSTPRADGSAVRRETGIQGAASSGLSSGSGAPISGDPGGTDRRNESRVSGPIVDFFIDNRHCSRPLVVFLDGERLGTVPGASERVFEAAEGRHRLCLAREDRGNDCDSSSKWATIRVYDGFGVRPGC